MLFNSIEFLVFLPIVFLVYWHVLNKKIAYQNIFIVLVSYLFYGWWDYKLLLLIAFTSLVSFLSGIFISRVRSGEIALPEKYCYYVNAGNIAVNILILCVFKYYNFFAVSLADAFSRLGVDLSISTLSLILPVGISFYTFQALSYSIDLYRKDMQATKDVVTFFAYVSFFPQLVAGPIERATHLLPQFQKPRKLTYEGAADGLRQMLWGFFKKVVIADNCAPLVNQIFGNYMDASASTLVLGAIYFSFQIYGDFSGYSDIAIGCAKLFGIDLMRNFHLPYFSRDVAEFWRRWHISLTTWFRDYIYIPLGGSRLGKWISLRNTLIVFFVSGLWHGANWTFVAWGVYHAVLFVPLLLLGKNRLHQGMVAQDRWFPSLLEVFNMGITFVLVTIGWVFFRAPSLFVAFDYLSNIFQASLFTMPAHMDKYLILMILFMVSVEWVQRTKAHPLELSWLKHPVVRWGAYYVVCFLMLMLMGKDEAFIYFQF